MRGAGKPRGLEHENTDAVASTAAERLLDPSEPLIKTPWWIVLCEMLGKTPMRWKPNKPEAPPKYRHYKGIHYR